VYSGFAGQLVGAQWNVVYSGFAGQLVGAQWNVVYSGFAGQLVHIIVMLQLLTVEMIF